MAQFLYRLGRLSYRRRGRVLAGWAVVFVALIGAAVAFSGPQSSEFSVPGTESQRALDALEDKFPAAVGASGTVALRAVEGETFDDASVRADVDKVATAAAHLDGVLAVQSPLDTGLVSSDGRTAILAVQYAKANADLTEEQRDAYADLADTPTNTGLRVVPGGDPTTAPAEAGATEGIGVLIALVILIVTLGSLIAAGMTLLNAIVGVALGLVTLTAFSGLVEMNSTAPILALMLGLAVGIDYALFITARFRSLLQQGNEPEAAAGRAVATAGSAVVFAGATVVIALAALAVVGIPFIGVMGLAAAGTVAIAVLVSLSMLPAILGFAGRRVLPRRLRRAPASDAPEASPDNSQNGLGLRWARWVVKRRVPVLAVGIVALAALALPTLDLRMALSDDGSAPAGTAQRESYDLIAEGFGAGFNARLILVATSEGAAETAKLAESATAVISKLPNVVRVEPAGVSEDGTTATLLVVPKDGPSSESTANLVHSLRAAVADIPASGEALDLTGLTAIGIDVSERLGAAFPLYLVLVVGLSLLLLLIAFRSVLVPLKATVGFLLSLGATFGVTVEIFQWGWLASALGVESNGAVDSLLPILLVGILFGLAMDYEVFLVSRMREEHAAGQAPNESVISGVRHGSRVVTAAALIMTSVFGGFVLIDDPTLKAIGFALALGVLIDAFVVRLTLVPAVMSLLGRRAWTLPRWLDRLVPRIDLEGEHLASTAN